MNYLILTDSQGGTARLTDEHAASSYGIPVLVVDAEDCQGAFGPADLLDEVVHAADVVLAWAVKPERTPDERDAARLYLQQWPVGPQLPK